MMSVLKSGKRSTGFTLVEMLISMVVFSIVMGIIYSFLLQTKKDLSESEVELSLTDNAQSAINALRKDLYQIGIGRDADQEQPMILRAGMYDLIFVADLDREVRNTEKRFGTPDRVNYGMSFSPGSPFAPLYFLYDTAIPEIMRYTGWDPDAVYGMRNMGAEIVRYSLDSNGDNVINALDLENNITLEGSRTHTMNEQDFWLFKEWWGCVKTTSGFENQHSGLHPVAFNIRGMFYNPLGGTSATALDRFRYPNSDYPKILFTYWGHFYNTVTDHDDPSDPNWPGEPIELWGDWGNQYPVQLNQPMTPGADGARNGVLDQNEIRNMMQNPLLSQVNLNYMMMFTGRAGESPDGDENGNGIPGENRLDQFIRRIGVNIVVESDLPNPKQPNLQRSAPPNYYNYRDYEVSIQINPRNLAYAGSPLVDMGQMTPTPLPPTATPVPPTNTPDPMLPTNTPEDTSTPDPMASPTPTPDAFGFDEDDGEVIMGGLHKIFGMSISRIAATMNDVCSLTNHTEYLAQFGFPVTQVKPANLCDPVSFFDEWNDVVLVNSADNGMRNLYYFKHNTETSINGFTLPKSLSVGYHPKDRITAVAVGNLGTFGLVPTEYDEVVVAFHRYDTSASLKETFLEILALNAPCGELLPVENPSYFRLTQNLTSIVVKDMVIADFNGDGLGDLVTLTSFTDGNPQLMYFPNIHSDGWSNSVPLPVLDFGENIQGAKLIAETVYTGNEKLYKPDLIVVAENGAFAVIPNFREITDPNMPFNLPNIRYCDTNAFTDFNNVKDAIVYDANNLSGFNDYAPLLAICGNSDIDDNIQLVHYDMRSSTNLTIPIPHCSGTIWPFTGSALSVKGMAYVPVDTTFGTRTHLVIPVNASGLEYAVIIRDPYYATTSLIDPSVNCQRDLFSIIGAVNCIASTRNSLSLELGYMPTPTPVDTATPTP